MPKVKCNHCKEYIDREDAYRTSLQSFCDLEHYKASLKKEKKPAKKKKDWDKISELVKKLDGYRCRVCSTKKNLHVHHIHYRSEMIENEDSFENLITLCLEHHDLVHSDKEYYQPECLRVRKSGSMLARIKIKVEE